MINSMCLKPSQERPQVNLSPNSAMLSSHTDQTVIHTGQTGIYIFMSYELGVDSFGELKFIFAIVF